MIVSELWSGWFDSWGDSAHNGKTAASLDRMMHELTAVGTSGVSHWVFAGGTNFGWYGGRTVGGDTIHMTTSYDYDAPITEYGGLTEKFFVARRHHLFLSTLGAQVSHLLAEAKPGGPTVIVAPVVKGRWAGGEEPFRTVKNGDFSATFLQNTTADRTTLQVFNTDPNVHLAIDVDAHSLKPIYFNLSRSLPPLRIGGGCAQARGWGLESITTPRVFSAIGPGKLVTCPTSSSTVSTAKSAICNCRSTPRGKLARPAMRASPPPIIRLPCITGSRIGRKSFTLII